MVPFRAKVQVLIELVEITVKKMAYQQNSQKKPLPKLVTNEVPKQQIGAVNTLSSTQNTQNLLKKRLHADRQVDAVIKSESLDSEMKEEVNSELNASSI